MGDEILLNVPAQKQEPVSELFLGQIIPRLPFHTNAPGLIPSPRGGECRHLSKGWPHLLRPAQGGSASSAHIPRECESQALPRGNNGSLLSHRTLFWLGKTPAPPPVKHPTHACSDILKCGSYR